MKRTTYYLLPATLLLTLITCSNTDEPIINKDLLGVVWIVDSLETRDTTLVSLAGGGYANIQFGNDMQVSGITGGHVRYRGSYEIIDPTSLDIILLEPTELSCSRPSMTCLFVDALKTVTNIILSENTLRLSDDEGNIITFHSGLVDKALLVINWESISLWSPSITAELERDSIRYETKVNDSVTTSHMIGPYNQAAYIVHIQFDREMQIGAIICNNGGGIYEIDQVGTISISRLGWTEALCAPWNLLEDLLTEVFENVTRYDIIGDQLELRSQDGNYSAVFRAY